MEDALAVCVYLVVRRPGGRGKDSKSRGPGFRILLLLGYVLGKDTFTPYCTVTMQEHCLYPDMTEILLSGTL